MGEGVQFLQNASAWFYLNSFSVGAMIPVAFFAITGFFLLSVKNKSKATVHMGIAYIMMGVYNLGYVISSSIYHPAAAYHRWMAVASILMAEIHFTMLFFCYPEEKTPFASRLYFRASYLGIIAIFVYFCYQTLTTGKNYVFLGQYWDFNAFIPNKIVALAVMWFIFLVPVLSLWRAVTSSGKERWIILLMGASLLLGSLVPGIFNLLNRNGIVDRNVFQMAWTVFTMAGFFTLIMLYVNNAREKISFVGKLITVTAITILAILHFISHYSLKDRDAAYDAIRLKDARLATATRFIPDDLAYKAAFTVNARGLISDNSSAAPLPVDPVVVKYQLYNTAMAERILNLSRTDFLKHLKNLLHDVPPHFKGCKDALLIYFEAIAPFWEPRNREIPKHEITTGLRHLNHLLFVQSNKIEQLPESEFRMALSAYLEKQTDPMLLPIKNAIYQHLNTLPQHQNVLKTEVLRFLLPVKGPGERIYRYSRNNAQHYIAYAVTDQAAGKIFETGFYYRDYRKYMHDAVFKYVLMILMLILVSRYGFYWFFYELLVKPLKALTRGLLAVERGNLNASVPVVTEDEIGYISRAFNTMVASIKEAERKLQNEKDNLLAAHNSLEASHQEIRLLQHFLSNIIESMPSVLISVDKNAKVTQWNTAAEKLTGIRAVDILGQRLWDFRSPFYRLKPYYHDVIDSRKPLLFTREQLQHTIAGDDKFYNIALYPLVANGISGAVVRIDDITKLERMEQQLRQAQKMDTIGTLAGGLAHDFNNILGGIVGTLSLLKFKLAKGEPLDAETTREYINTMEQAGNRAADMAQQLLTLSRKQELSFAPVDLNNAIGHVVKISRNTFDKSIEIKTRLPAEYPVVQADPGQIEQVLLNLFVNAAHAMTLMRPKGQQKGGILTISLEQIKADKFFCIEHPEAEEGETYWGLSVQDSGVGMDTKTIAKIFDPFFTTKEKGKGTGLGLAMVYNIIQLHKGFIDVYSEVGVGTSFNIYLPKIKETENTSSEKTQSRLSTGTGVILIIDDEEIMREMARNILIECGYTPLTAKNGEQGIAIFKQEHSRIRMVLLDMVMPRMSGRETFMAIKKVAPEVRVLLTSGFKKNQEVEELLKLGVKDFIQKPFTLEELARKTRDVMH